ncbi:MAG: RluA family pseudouridine synthase [Planctomycetota bacterium]
MDLDQHTLVVEDDLSGTRLFAYLERTWPTADRAALRGLLRDGGVTVNGADAHATTRLRAGDVVLVDLPEDGLREYRGEAAREGKAAAVLPVLAESSFALIVDKPAGLPCVPDRFGRSQGVHGMLADLRPGDDLRIAHRIDRFTSGCLALAKGVEGARWLDLCFREGRVRKEYLALVQGVIHEERREIRRALGPDPRRPGKVMVMAKDDKGAREAVTVVEVVERFRAHTLLRVLPQTGRGHQIRVHLASLHHPIVADVDYGAEGPLLLSSIKPGYKTRRGVAEKPLLARFFLHAALLELPAPDGGTPLFAHAPLPDDLTLALDKLRRFAR